MLIYPVGDVEGDGDGDAMEMLQNQQVPISFHFPIQYLEKIE